MQSPKHPVDILRSTSEYREFLTRELRRVFGDVLYTELLEFFEKISTYKADAFIFVTRKSYFMYLIAKMNLLWKGADNQIIMSDCRIDKVSPGEFDGKQIMVIDDTSSTGTSLSGICNKLRENSPDSVLTPVVFVLNTNFDAYSKFEDGYLEYFKYMTTSQINTFTADELILTHTLGLIYYVEMPVFSAVIDVATAKKILDYVGPWRRKDIAIKIGVHEFKQGNFFFYQDYHVFGGTKETETSLENCVFEAVRANMREFGDQVIFNITPLKLFSWIDYDAIKCFFEKLKELIPDAELDKYDKMFDIFSDPQKKYAAADRQLTYILCYALGLVFGQYVEDEFKVRLTREYYIDYHFTSDFHDFIDRYVTHEHLPYIKKSFYEAFVAQKNKNQHKALKGSKMRDIARFKIESRNIEELLSIAVKKMKSETLGKNSRSKDISIHSIMLYLRERTMIHNIGNANDPAVIGAFLRLVEQSNAAYDRELINGVIYEGLRTGELAYNAFAENLEYFAARRMFFLNLMDQTILSQWVEKFDQWYKDFASEVGFNANTKDYSEGITVLGDEGFREWECLLADKGVSPHYDFRMKDIQLAEIFALKISQFVKNTNKKSDYNEVITKIIKNTVLLKEDKQCPEKQL